MNDQLGTIPVGYRNIRLPVIGKSSQAHPPTKTLHVVKIVYCFTNKSIGKVSKTLRQLRQQLPRVFLCIMLTALVEGGTQHNLQG